eukprot:12227826-Ditylum_brightwellii.AAC.1
MARDHMHREIVIEEEEDMVVMVVNKEDKEEDTIISTGRNVMVEMVEMVEMGMLEMTMTTDNQERKGLRKKDPRKRTKNKLDACAKHLAN